MVTLTRRLRQDRRLLAAILVGSLAKDTADALSDIDLLIMVRKADFPSVWRSRHGYLRELAPVIYRSQESVARNDMGTLRALTEDGVMLELAFFAKDAPFHLRGPYRVLFDRGAHVAEMPRASMARAGPRRVLPGGPGDFPFALHDALKLWIRGRRDEAIEILTAVLRSARQESTAGSRRERRRPPVPRHARTPLDQ